MTSVFRTASCQGASLKIGLALALLVGQAYAQSAASLPAGASLQVPDQPEVTKNGKVKEEVALPDTANKEGPVIVTTDKLKVPKTKRQVKLGKVKPDQYTSKPQQAVKALR